MRQQKFQPERAEGIDDVIKNPSVEDGSIRIAERDKTTVKKGTYTAADLAGYLSISLVGAYNLMQSQGFPSFRIGRRILVTREAFNQWLQEQQRKGT